MHTSGRPESAVRFIHDGDMEGEVFISLPASCVQWGYTPEGKEPHVQVKVTADDLLAFAAAFVRSARLRVLENADDREILLGPRE